MKTSQMSMIQLKLTVALQEGMGFHNDKETVDRIMNLPNDTFVTIGDEGIKIITHDIKQEWKAIGNTNE